MRKSNAISANDYLNSPKWYIITVISGNEDSVIKNLKGKISSYGFNDSVTDIRIIKEKVVTIEEFSADKAPSNVGRNRKNIQWKTIDNNGKITYQKIKSEDRNKFGGYIFIKMFMDEKIWFIIRNTQLVTGIIGSSGKNTKPIPVSDDEIEKILNYETYGVDSIINDDENKINDIYKEDDSIVLETTIYKADFNIGDRVHITSNNALGGDEGIVVAMNDNKGIATIEMEIFNRVSNIDVPYANLEKIK